MCVYTKHYLVSEQGAVSIIFDNQGSTVLVIE